MELTQNPLFITYYLKKDTSELEVICKACREIIFLDYELPSYIKGLIKYEEDFIPVIDPNIYFHGQQSMLSNLACILIMECVYNCRKYRTGIIIEDIDEIMNIAAGNYSDSSCAAPATFNMSFIIDALKKGQSEQFLFNTQKLLNMHEKRKHIMKRPFVECNNDVMDTELVERAGTDENDIFDTNEFLVTI